MNLKKPVDGSLTLADIRTKINQGDLVIPDFQRDFVWSVNDSAALLDSWIKGYPLGSFILWVSKDKLNILKNIGSLPIAQQVNPENPLTYILDGQQRITSIYASTIGLKIDSHRDFSKIAINLDAEGDDDIIIVLPENPTFEYVLFKDIIDPQYFWSLFNKYQTNTNYLNKIQQYYNALISFSFPTIKIEDVSLNVATEIFTRLNTGGKPLTVFEIMVAKTYENNLFNLKDKTKEVVDKYGDYLNDKFYALFLKSISACLKGDSKQKTILSLTKNDIINNFDKVAKAFDHAIDYFKTTLNIPTSNLFPYTDMIIPYVYFYYKLNPPAFPVLTPKQESQLLDYYYRCILTERYQKSTDSIVNEDIRKVMDKILSHQDYNEFANIDIDIKKFIQRGEFKMTAYIKGLICLLISKKPSSLYNNSSIIFDTNWPIRTHSNNYHHFFPKKSNCIKSSTFKNDEVNNICNIILCDAVTNQKIIKNTDPSIYIPALNANNNHLADTLKNHFIDDITLFGIMNNDFDTFRKQRAKAILEELKTKLILMPNDVLDTNI